MVRLTAGVLAQTWGCQGMPGNKAAPPAGQDEAWGHSGDVLACEIPKISGYNFNKCGVEMQT